MTKDANQAIDPAAQPHKPGYCGPGPGPDDSNAPGCAPSAPPPGVPAICAPAPCKQVCNCPPAPPGDSNCFDKLIEAQASAINEAERAKSFKAELETLMQKAKVAQEAYTLEKYEQLLDRWIEQDRAIAELIAKVVCGTCWVCQIECQVCSLFNKIRDLELRLNGEPAKAYDQVYSLKDQRYWQERDLERAQTVFDRIKKVLTAWEKPAAGIEAILNDNQKLIATVQLMAPDSAKALYDVFIRLVPLHLAIAPPAGPDAAHVTLIDKKYTLMCGCDSPAPDDCCGPDVGEQTVRRRMLGQYACLIKPVQYFPIICCLVQTRFLPAKDALAKAEAALKNTDAEIKRVADEIKARMESIEKDAKTELAREFDCAKYKPIGDNCAT